MSMSVTFPYPGDMRFVPEHTQSGGRGMVYIDDQRGDSMDLLLWVTPEVAAQWIKTLQPLADRAPLAEQVKP